MLFKNIYSPTAAFMKNNIKICRNFAQNVTVPVWTTHWTCCKDIQSL